MWLSAGRVAGWLAIIILHAAGSPCAAQQAGTYETDRQAAYQLFARGRLRDAAAALGRLTTSAPDTAARLAIQRDMLEVCSFAYDVRCVFETIQAMLPAIEADRNLRRMVPEVILYQTKAKIWSQDDDNVRDVLRRGGASAIANVVTEPATHAELQLELHAHHIRRNDLAAAEQNIAGAVLGLLLSDPGAPYPASKILVRLIGALIDAQDAVGAFQLLKATGQFIDSSVGRESPLYAEHLQNVSRLFAFTSLNRATASLLSQAAGLFEALQMDEDVKAGQIEMANSLGSAALVLDGKLEQARELHAKHPMQQHRDAILQRGQFAKTTEFYFAVSDVFLGSIRGKPDQRWNALFEKELSWKIGSIQLANLNSYRSFCLGLLGIGRPEREAGDRLLAAAARQRVDTFEEVMRANFEGFQLPSAIDRLVVSAGLTAAAKAGGSENIDLVLRGGEFLGRTLRDALSDVAVLLGSQADDRSRRNAQSYIHLLRQKREWEIEQIRKFISKDSTLLQNRGALINQYADVVSKVTALKTRLQTSGGLHQTKGLPHLEAVQQSLSDREAFVTYFPTMDGIGKLCIRRNNAIVTTSQFESTTSRNHVRLLQFATAADHPADAKLDKQFPVSSALYLRDVLFGGLDACMAPGTHVIVALPGEFAGVPLGALLTEAPPADGDGFDLAKAPWLINQMSFSVVGSARQYLAALPLDHRPVAARAFLGIGDPSLDQTRLASAPAAAVYRGSVKTPNGTADFGELPETADELKGAARMFSAAAGDVLLKGEATEEAFRLRPLAEYDVIHFATHGLIKEDLPGLTEAALLLTPEAPDDSFNDGLLSVSEISRLTLGARLIVLSACNTAKYDLTQAGIGIQDFQTAFTIAGAPTVLAALWSIDSRAARDIVTEFFHAWRSGAAPFAADALATATRSYLAGADAPHQHPRFWAAFQIAGYGHARGAPENNGAAAEEEFKPVPSYETGGEIMGAGRVGDDFILSMIGGWDGQKMSSIIGRVGADGAKGWEVKSRDIGAGGLLVVDGTTYALGYAFENDTIPLIRAFDPNGRLQWTTRFKDLEGYTFSDIAGTGGRLFVIAYPTTKAGDSHQAFLLQLDGGGAEQRRVAIAVGARGFSIGPPGFIKAWNDSIAVALNFGAATGLNHERKNVFGLPSFCFGNASARVYEFDLKDLRVQRIRSIPGFKVGSMVADDGLYVGGEATDDCAMRGHAAIYRLQTEGEASPFWSDDTLFASDVVGMGFQDDRVLAAVRQERALGIESRARLPDGYDKRWGDEKSASLEGSLLYLDRAGGLAKRKDYSAGLAVFVRGLGVFGPHPILYGAVGGMPAFTRH